MDSQVIKSMQEAALFSLKRLNIIDDPILRYSMFLEVIRMGCEFGLLAMRDSIRSDKERLQEDLEDLEDVDPSIKNKERRRNISKLETNIANLKQAEIYQTEMHTEFTKYLDNFNLWIKQPMYGPDHPFGKHMMNEAEADLIHRSSHKN
jgi:hypothetical protein